MARTSNKFCRRWITLAEVVLLPWLYLTGSSAGDAMTSKDTAVDSALITDSGDASSRAGGTDVYLDVTLNGAHDGLAHFNFADGELWASHATMSELGFILPAHTPDPVRLNRIPGVKASYDVNQQTVALTAPLGMLKLDTTVLNAPDNSRPHASASPGMLLNYQVYAAQGQRDTSNLSAFTELRAFNDDGVFSSTALTQSAHSDDANWQSRTVRLDTSWSTSFPDSLLTLRLGDTLTDALSWSRSTRIAGVQIGTNFALQPYLITAPLPAFFGSATLPSDVQLYVDGVKQYSGRVPAGPFQLNTTPNISGAGNAQVVLTNALGQATTLNFSLYDEHQLLQAGLSDWSAEIGFVRENYGLTSFDYAHDPAASGTWRYGVSNNLTVETHAEATNGLADAGGGGSWLIGTQGGVVSASLARSEGSNQSGTLYDLGYSWRDQQFNFSVDGIRTQGHYSDIATAYGGPPPSISAQALVGYTTQHLGSYGVNYIHLRYPGEEANRYGGLYWFKSIGESFSINVSYNQNLNNASDRSVFVIATLSLDHNITVSGSVQRTDGRDSFVAQANQAVPSQGGWGWRADVSNGDNQNGGAGEVDYLGRYGQIDVGVNGIGDSRYGYANAIGSVVLMGGEVFAARQISDGFAVVSTDGVPGVPVSLENNPIGTTDSHGLLLVTPLNAYQNNHVSIDPMNMPADVRIDTVQTIATPTDRAGTLVHFGIARIQAASIILDDENGKPLPLGSTVDIEGQTSRGDMVGFDGTVYLDTLRAHNVLDVHAPSGECHVAVDYRKTTDDVPTIGPLACRKGAIP